MKSNLITTGSMKLERLIVRCCRHIFVLLTLGICISAHGAESTHPLVQYEGVTTTNKSWFYADHQGSVVATADSAGVSTGVYSYGPYGEPNNGGPARFQYTGQQYFANLGLYYYKARFYSPTLGKFMQSDPIGYGYSETAGLLNNGASRFGWTYNGAKEADVISLRVGKIHFDMPGTAVNVGANPVRDGAVADVVGGIVTTPTQAQAASPAIPAMVRLL